MVRASATARNFKKQRQATAKARFSRQIAKEIAIGTDPKYWHSARRRLSSLSGEAWAKLSNRWNAEHPLEEFAQAQRGKPQTTEMSSAP